MLLFLTGFPIFTLVRQYPYRPKLIPLALFPAYLFFDFPKMDKKIHMYWTVNLEKSNFPKSFFFNKELCDLCWNSRICFSETVWPFQFFNMGKFRSNVFVRLSILFTDVTVLMGNAVPGCQNLRILFYQPCEALLRLFCTCESKGDIGASFTF